MRGRCRNAAHIDGSVLAAIMCEQARRTGRWSAQAAADHMSGAAHMIARGWVRVWQEGSEIVGFLARDDTLVHALYVSAARQGQGVGSALLEDAKTATGALTLWTDARNTRAGRFYARAGFQETICVPSFASSDGLNERWFAWHCSEKESA